MRTCTRPLAMVIALLVLAACSGPTDDGGAEPDGPATSPDRATDVEAWDSGGGWDPLVAAPAAAPEESWRIPVRRGDDGVHLVADEAILVADRAASGDQVTVARIDPADGSEQWRTPVDASAPISLETDRAGSVVALVEEIGPTSTRATVLDTETGSEVWQGTGLDDAVTVDTVGDVLLVSGFPESTAVDRSTGETRWTTDRFLTVSDGQILAEDLEAADDPGKTNVAVVDPATGRSRWELHRPLFGDVQVVGTTLMLTQDRKGGTDQATAYDLADGAERWSVDLPSIGRARVQPAGGEAVLVSGTGEAGASHHNVFALDLADGAQLWRAKAAQATSLLVDAKPRVLLSRTRAVELVDGSTGKVLHRADPAPGVGLAGLAGGAYYDGQGDEVLARALPGLRVVWQAAVAEGEQLAGVVPRGFVTDKLGEGSGELVGYTG